MNVLGLPPVLSRTGNVPSVASLAQMVQILAVVYFPDSPRSRITISLGLSLQIRQFSLRWGFCLGVGARSSPGVSIQGCCGVKRLCLTMSSGVTSHRSVRVSSVLLRPRMIPSCRVLSRRVWCSSTMAVWQRVRQSVQKNGGVAPSF